LACICIDKIRGNPGFVSGLANTAFDQIADPKLSMISLDLVPVPLKLSMELREMTGNVFHIDKVVMISSVILSAKHS